MRGRNSAPSSPDFRMGSGCVEKTASAAHVVPNFHNVRWYVTLTLSDGSAQRYEAASTIFGPHTLSAYIQQFSGLAKAIAEDTVSELPRGPQPPFFNESDLNSLLPFIPVDKAPANKTFGSVLEDVEPHYLPGEVASVTFVAGNPRSSVKYMSNNTYLKVEKYEDATRAWRTVCNDASWETRYYWHKGTDGQSNATIEWHIPSSAASGIYRISHFGHRKLLLPPTIRLYEGTSSEFEIKRAFR
ncbi:unnamed protein product [Ranitomeya imitator]|uniref:Neutral/alkaline non-lysosomal ceramidase C-terminal domain-containing protein n=1 Tax=Ranitomeya imitator TaxID=111125 RepID=A0ABN9KRE7_9NEOB|nr:unnamed protein product [Ranitomeya imitator]